ncbi:LytR family transcriptional regulator [Pseudonocardiaceae bacterium YIM PH 21723]|nr:LytR family transcriptional regulator [Pseudonocardiaceae bacterium YIM PH 21723]
MDRERPPAAAGDSGEDDPAPQPIPKLTDLADGKVRRQKRTFATVGTVRHQPRPGQKKPAPAEPEAQTLEVVPPTPVAAEPPAGPPADDRPTDLTPPVDDRPTELIPPQRGRPVLKSISLMVKTLLTVTSLLVLTGTAYSWVTYEQLSRALTTSGVLGKQGSGLPATPDGATDILLVGIDSRYDAQGNPLPKDALAMLHAGVSDGELNSDTMMVVRIKNDGTEIKGFSIPRDSYVDIPGYGKHKINSAYPSAYNTEFGKLKNKGGLSEAEVRRQAQEAGRQLLVETISKFAGVSIDHFVEVNLLGFYQLSQAIGGVKVCLKNAVNDPEYSGADFSAGEHTIQGAEALSFVRQRYGLPNGDFDRARRQQVFLAGVAKKIGSAGVLTDTGRIQQLINAAQGSLVIDRDWNVLTFAQQMQGVAGGKLKFETIPVTGDAMDPYDGAILTVDPVAVKRWVRNLVGAKDGKPGRPQDDVDPSAISVGVTNSTGTKGIGGPAMEKLTAQGYQPGLLALGPTQRDSVVHYAEGDRAAAEAIATQLGDKVKVQKDASLSQGTVLVVLGSDYLAKSVNKLGASGPLALDGRSPQAPPQPDPTPTTQASEQILPDGTPCVN